MADRQNGALGGHGHENKKQKKNGDRQSQVKDRKWVCDFAAASFGSVYGISSVLYRNSVFKALGRIVSVSAKIVCNPSYRTALYRIASADVKLMGAVFQVFI